MKLVDSLRDLRHPSKGLLNRGVNVKAALGVLLYLASAAIIFVRNEISTEESLPLLRLVLELSSAVVIAVATYLFAAQFAQPNKRHGSGPRTETIDSANWAPTPKQSDNYIAEETVEIVTTATGTAYVQRIRLRCEPSGSTSAEFTVVRLYESAYWRFNSATDLYARPRKPVRLEEEIDSVHIKQLLSHVDHILCLGLVSSAEANDKDADGLSNRRATNLSERMKYSSVVLEENIRFHAVPLGQARTPRSKGTKEERGQRTAVIIGIRIDNKLVSLNQALDELTPRIRSEAIRLDDYPGSLRTN
ncbi:MAG: hypothetical protein ABJL57_16890 [Hyphomonas sp.]|uniref:hypothetical protein n=1 Tax=unclassified Hyphomonas TaxID=2630699 RepID=UPI0012EBB983|nr:hypothetical protein [Hyphomonas sp. L-53-1-40]